MESYAGSAEAKTDAVLPGAEAELRDAIVRRARELWEQRGRVDGHAEEDWLQAEAEVRRERETAVRPCLAYIVVRAGKCTYTGEYDLARCDTYKPGDLARGAELTVRFEGEKMHIRLPNGRELETRVVKKARGQAVD